jgi:hypothetical protein
MKPTPGSHTSERQQQFGLGHLRYELPALGATLRMQRRDPPGHEPEQGTDCLSGTPPADSRSVSNISALHAATTWQARNDGGSQLLHKL